MSLLLTACTSIGFFLANAPVSYAHMTVKRNVSYGPESYQTLDIYTPETPSRHTIIFYYGGGWKMGDKKDYTFIAEYFVTRGYNVVIPDYGLYPDVVYPEFLENSARAAAWVHKHIASDSLFLLGHSAGAYNAAMIAVNDSYLKPFELSANDINGVIGISGPYNFSPTEKIYKDIFGHKDNYDFMHVSTYVNGSEPPFLLMHGRDDGTVSPENTRQLAQQLKANGNTVQRQYYDDIGHYKIIAAFTSLLKDRYPVAEDVVMFLEAHKGVSK